ncbi:MAG: DNA/RNA nuclease SfsA, partial [Candidatus Geothermincolales bacterium]
ERRNRFLLSVEVEGREEAAHLPNPGRLQELLLPGARLLLLPIPDRRPSPRKTRFEAFAVKAEEGWTTIDSRLPNRLFREALERSRLKPFRGYGSFRPEFPFAGGRVDFLLRGDGLPDCLVEVKGCTLVRRGTALFPDAPTLRGTRHLAELGAAATEGYRACVVFIVQRPGARLLRPNDETDPAFAREARRALERGVEFFAFRTLWERGELELGPPIPVEIPVMDGPGTGATEDATFSRKRERTR